MTRLRQRMLEDLRIGNYAASTARAYIRAVARFALYFGVSPDRLGPEEIRAYQLHLIEERKLAWSTVNTVVCALRLFFTTTLGRPDVVARIRYARPERPLPVVLSQPEVLRLLHAVDIIKYRTMLMVAYGIGVRVSELVNLQIRDIDSQRMVIHIRHGKRAKDRFVPLAPILLDQLRKYWLTVRSEHLLFPGRDPQRPISCDTVQSVCRKAARDAGIRKRVTPHTLRHSFATHLRDAGTDLGIIQAFLGHSDPESTEIYAHISVENLRSTKTPLHFILLPIDRAH